MVNLRTPESFKNIAFELSVL
jgi:hypothetical protein